MRQAAERLLRALADDASWDIREAVARALGSITKRHPDYLKKIRSA